MSLYEFGRKKFRIEINKIEKGCLFIKLKKNIFWLKRSIKTCTVSKHPALNQ